MIGDSVIEQVYEALTVNPQRSRDIAEKLRMPLHRVSFILAILKRQKRAKRVDLCIHVGCSLYASRSFWVKTQ